MRSIKPVWLLSLAAALVMTAVSGCRKTAVGECVKRGVAAADRNDWNTALKFAEKGVESAPRNIDALLLKAISAQRCRQPEVAYAAAARAAEIEPKNFFAQYILGCACVDCGNRQAEAKSAFQAALKLRENDPCTLVALCNLTAETGDRDLLKYLKLLESNAIRSITDSAAFHNQKGVALLRVGDRDNALREFNAAMKMDWKSPNPDIIYNAACGYDNYRLTSKNRQSVRAIYERYLKLTVNDKSAEPTRILVKKRVSELGGR